MVLRTILSTMYKFGEKGPECAPRRALLLAKKPTSTKFTRLPRLPDHPLRVLRDPLDLLVPLRQSLAPLHLTCLLLLRCFPRVARCARAQHAARSADVPLQEIWETSFSFFFQKNKCMKSTPLFWSEVEWSGCIPRMRQASSRLSTDQVWPRVVSGRCTTMLRLQSCCCEY